MKAVILSLAEPRGLSAAQIFTKYFEQNNIEYDIICTNRYGKGGTTFKGKLFQFDMLFGVETKRINKILPFLKFKEYALNILKRNKYDFIVVWNENTMILFADYLLRRKHDYCVNIRDFDYNKNPLIERIRKTISDYALFTTIPTVDKPPFLCDYRTIPMISILPQLPSGCVPHKKIHTNPINISYIGTFPEANNQETRELLLSLKNDYRFRLNFIGTGSELLSDFVRRNEINNVRLLGSFDMDQIADFLNEADIINADYGDSKYIEYLYMPNKAGYAIKMYQPIIIGNKQITLAKQVNKYNLGFVIDEKDNLGNKLYEWYTGLDYEDLISHFDAFIQKNEEINYNIITLLNRKFGLH